MLNSNTNGKVFNFFNSFFLSYFTNLFIKQGKSKNFKKKYIKLFSYTYIQNSGKVMPTLNAIFKKYITNKYCYIILFNKTTKTFVNHKKKFIQNLNFNLLKKNNSFFFIKYTKYIYMKKNWKHNLKNIIKYEILHKKSLTYAIFFLIFRNLIKKMHN